MEVSKHPRLLLGQGNGCFLQFDNGVPLLRTTPTQIIEYREIKLAPTWSLHPYILVSLAWEGALQATKREM